MTDEHPAGETPDQSPEARFGDLLRRERERADLTVRELADRLHRAHSGVVEFERGRRLPAAEVVEQVEDVLGLVRGTLGAPRERARVERLENPRDGTVAANLGDVPCPYQGLRPFEADDAGRYYGREAQVRDVLARLAATRFVAIVGPSGSGKSSFVRAGLLAGMRGVATASAASPRAVLLTPGEHPVHALADAVAGVLAGAGRALASELGADPRALVRVAGRAAGSLVIVVDQFEELFTLCHDEADRRCFVDALVSAWRDPTSPVVVILALRADFYGRVAAYPELAAGVVAHQELIGPLGPADLLRAIELPAAASGLMLQPGLARTVLDDLADEPGALPLLSHALLETWKRRRRLQLTIGGYREAGGVRGAIAQTAERTLLSLPEADRDVARSIFLSLTEVGEGAEPTRRRVDRAELAGDPGDAERVARVLDILAAARLVSVEERTVVVAHEALIRHWPRLSSWIDADRAGLVLRRRMADAAREWDKLAREPGALYRGGRLAAAGEWAAEHPRAPSALEREFLRASQAAAGHEVAAGRRRTRRLRVLAGGLAVLSSVVAALALVAREQRGEAQKRASEARSLALVASATPLQKSRPDVSVLLALEANRVRATAQAESAAFATLQDARDHGIVAMLHGHDGAISDIAFSPDRRTLASAGYDGTILLWDVGTHRRLGRPRAAHNQDVGSLTFSPDGRTLAWVDGSAIRLWDVGGREKRSRVFVHAQFAMGSVVSFGRDGDTIAGIDPILGTVRRWDVRSRQRIGTFRWRGQSFAETFSGPDAVALSPDGETAAVASGAIRLWDVETGKRLGPALPAAGRTAHGVAFSADGATLATTASDGTIELWDVASHERTATFKSPPRPVEALAVALQGGTLASVTARTIRLWDIRSRARLLKAHMSGHAVLATSVAFSADGSLLASGGLDSTIRLWTLRPDRPPAPTPARGGLVLAGALLPGRHRPALATADGAGVRLRDVRTMEDLPGSLRIKPGLVDELAFSPDGGTLATSRGAGVELWDMRTFRALGRFAADAPAAARGVNAVAPGPGGRVLAVADGNGIVRLWDVGSRKQITALRAGRDGAWALAFSPDGRMLATAGEAGTIRLWDPRTGRQLGEPLAAQGVSVTGMAFSGDGRRLVGDGAQTAAIWNVEARLLLGTFPTTRVEPGLASAFSPDGRSIWIATSEDAVTSWTNVLWRDFDELRAKVCGLVGAGLSRAEWGRYAPGIPYHKSCP